MFNKVHGKLKNMDFNALYEIRHIMAATLGVVVVKAPEENMIVLKWIASGMDSATFIFSKVSEDVVKYSITSGERQISLNFRAKLGRFLYSKGLVDEKTRIKML
ncbi:MAG: hypothetical protein K6A63_04205 [Acholeplasmatales bacterium]|nr:hypothetical protein [Acholeplasmatales bacterium]